MEKIKHYRLNLSLRKSLVLYVAVFAVLALILSIMTISICDNTVDTIRKSYPLAGEKMAIKLKIMENKKYTF